MNFLFRSPATAGILLLVLLLAVAGCRRQDRPAATEAELPPEPIDYPAAKARLQQMDPTAKVGRVIVVLPDERMAAVGDINVQAFQRGDTLQIVGADDQPIASAVVLTIVDDVLHVRYTPVGEGGRRPYVGDIAIRFTMPMR